MDGFFSPYGTVDVVRYQCQNPECKLYSLSRDEVCEYCGAEDSYGNERVDQVLRDVLILYDLPVFIARQGLQLHL